MEGAASSRWVLEAIGKLRIHFYFPSQGAAAAERLDLLSIGATNMYQSYPEDMGDPLHMFMGLVNGIGAKLSAQERSIIFEELPGAFYRSSQLLTALARTD